MKKLGYFVLFIATVVTISFGRFVGVQAYSMDEYNPICSENLTDEQKLAAGCGETRQATTVGLAIVQAAIGVAGLLALVFLILAGYKYIMAKGDAGQVAQAKNAILWSVVGLIVAIMAFAIIAFVSQMINSDANLGV